MTRLNDTRMMMSGAGDMAVALPQFAGPRTRVPEWLPAPPMPRAVPTEARKATKTRHGLWIPLNRETLAEKILIGALVVAAVIGIGYGFSSLVDLVQNWAGVTNGIGNLVQ